MSAWFLVGMLPVDLERLSGLSNCDDRAVRGKYIDGSFQNGERPSKVSTAERNESEYSGLIEVLFLVLCLVMRSEREDLVWTSSRLGLHSVSFDTARE